MSENKSNKEVGFIGMLCRPKSRQTANNEIYNSANNLLELDRKYCVEWGTRDGE